jgi:hypothetical protein
VTEIQVCSYEGNIPPARGDTSERVKVHGKFLKIFFSRTRRPISIRLGTNYLWVKVNQVSSNKGLGLFQREDNHKNVKMG